jgi:hypothetical protein
MLDTGVTANLQSLTSRADAAKLLNVSERSVNTAKKVSREGSPELIDAVQQGKVSVSAAADIAELVDGGATPALEIEIE